ncbi:MAG: endolytic transglycosylase MltG [Flavihumibacter sp.]
MKKAVLFTGMFLLVIAAVFAWLLLGPSTRFDKKTYYLEIPTGSGYTQLLANIEQAGLFKYPAVFNFVARRLDYPARVKAGRYAIQQGSSLLSVIRMLRNGRQEPVNLVITKLRTKEDFASLAGRKFEFDSLAFMGYLNNNDSLRRFGFNSSTIMAAVLPDTYTFYWNITPATVMEKLSRSYSQFWTGERKQAAAAQKLTPVQVSVLASIIDEETNRREEMGDIASVYINRLNSGMRLGADPTVKFALRNFGLKRIYEKHLQVESPYNTYRVSGLPPAPSARRRKQPSTPYCTPLQRIIFSLLPNPVFQERMYSLPITRST